MQIIRRILKLYLSLAIIICVLFGQISVFASQVDTERNVSLTIRYHDDDKSISGAGFKLFRVADVTYNGEYILSGDFKNYSVSFEGLSNDGWTDMAKTLAIYADRDSLLPLETGNTDKNGRLLFSQKSTGLYLVTGDKYDFGRYIYTPEPFLVSLPKWNKNDTWDYDVTSEPKFSTGDSNTPDDPDDPVGPDDPVIPDDPESLKVRVRIYWCGDDINTRPSPVLYTLYHEGNEYRQATYYKNEPFSLGNFIRKLLGIGRSAEADELTNLTKLPEAPEIPDNLVTQWSYLWEDNLEPGRYNGVVQETLDSRYNVTYLGYRTEEDGILTFYILNELNKEPDNETTTSAPSSSGGGSDTTSRTVVKKWRDNNNKDGNRPDQIVAQLLRDGKVVQTAVLSEENDWSHTWTSLDRKFEWTIAEEEVPDGYAVSISVSGRTYTITNTSDDNASEELPSTEDPSVEDTNPGITPGSEDSIIPNGPQNESNNSNNTDNTDDSFDRTNSNGIENLFDPYELADKLQSETESLPQTGILWWPIYLMYILGIGIFVVGRRFYFKEG